MSSSLLVLLLISISHSVLSHPAHSGTPVPQGTSSISSDRDRYGECASWQSLPSADSYRVEMQPPACYHSCAEVTLNLLSPSATALPFHPVSTFIHDHKTHDASSGTLNDPTCKLQADPSMPRVIAPGHVQQPMSIHYSAFVNRSNGLSLDETFGAMLGRQPYSFAFSLPLIPSHTIPSQCDLPDWGEESHPELPGTTLRAPCFEEPFEAPEDGGDASSQATSTFQDIYSQEAPVDERGPSKVSQRFIQ